MLKNYDIKLNNRISLHFGQESLCYLIPTIGFQRTDWKDVWDNRVSYLFAIKFLKRSCGITIQHHRKKSPTSKQ